MEIFRWNNDWNKINTKKELKELLKEYNGILTIPMVDYLNSLIELEFSVVRDYIKEEDRKALSELEVYKRIAMYNVYNGALKLFKQADCDCELEISGNNKGIEGLNVSALSESGRVTLFDYFYGKRFNSQPEIPEGYKTSNIGNISLFQTIENEEQRKAELDRVMNVLEGLYNERNPYHSRPGRYGGPASNWAFEHSNKISEYEERFTDLDSKKELSDADKKSIELTKYFHNLLLEDYGLTNKSFKDESKDSYLIYQGDKNQMNKTLVKRMPNLTIKDNIRYI